MVASQMDNDLTEPEEDENEYTGPTKFRSGLTVLDSEDDGSESTHPSQPSDDSRPNNITKV